jgi:hypothetical protein
VNKIFERHIEEKKEIETISPQDLRQICDEILSAIQQTATQYKKKTGVSELSENDLGRLKADLSDKITQRIEIDESDSTKQKILHDLYLPRMEDRRSRIEKAHEDTFTWIFSDHELSSDPSQRWDNFHCWLRAKSGIYWVAGKAGSGKSTLMKYLYDNHRTHMALSYWAGQETLVTASFYFWKSGSPLQKSQEGFLQSILYEVLKQCPEWIPTVLPWRWNSYQLYGSNHHPWTFWELSTAFDLLTTEKCKSSTRFCFFIDGLDEYDGDLSEIANLFRKFASATSDYPEERSLTSSNTPSNQLNTWALNVKICVSSRPLLVFEDTFKNYPTLMLQALTYNDIKKFVTSSLEENVYFRRLVEEDPQYRQLISDIVEKASGVFLWVRLVVQSLKDGLRDGDTISSLKSRVEALPSDLEAYFQHIMDGLERGYLQQAARMFEVALAARGPQPLMTFSYINEKDPGFAVKAETRAISQTDLTSKLESTRRQVLSRCKGLLEVYSSASKDPFQSDKMVDFLHRTVRDFLTSYNISQILKSSIDEGFDPNVALCGSYLVQTKTFPIESHEYELMKPLFILVGQTLFYASLAEQSAGKSQRVLLESLNSTMTEYQRRLPSIGWNPSRHWTNVDKGAKWDSSFLTLAIEANLPLYVSEQLEKEPKLLRGGKAGRPLLDYALRPFVNSDAGYMSQIKVAFLLEDSAGVMPPNPAMTRVLLKFGAKPNQKQGQSTVWVRFLVSLYKNKQHISALQMSSWMETIKVLVDSGADPSAYCPTGSIQKRNRYRYSAKYRQPITLPAKDVTTYSTPTEILTWAFGRDALSDYEDLLSLIARKQKWKISSCIVC